MTGSAGYPDIDRLATGLDRELVALRRDIHAHPELAGAEQRTAALVARSLTDAGLALTTGVGGHGIVAVLDGAGPGKTLAYRADMDAVDVDGVGVHLCGHDLHTAIGVGVAQVLARLRDRWAGRLVLLFQPAEEPLTGARAMIADGALSRTTPAEIYALHCAPVPVGAFAVMPGFGQPGVDPFRIELTGPGAAADGARLVPMIETLSTVRYPRTDAEFEQIVADMLTPDGPLATFVLAGAWLDTSGQNERGDGVVVRGWARAWPDERYPAIRDAVHRLAATVAGARVEYPEPPFPAMVCDRELSEALGSHLRTVPDVDDVIVLHAAYPFNGEDFALFLKEVPGAMCFLGVANAEAGLNGVPHHPDFGADERAIGVGVRAMASFLLSRLAS